MSPIILGFGSIETAVEEEVLKRLRQGDSAEAIEAHYNPAADINDKLDRAHAPERYSRMTIFPPENGEIKISFHHVNRQHPFSPDGWAGLIIKRFLKEDEVPA